MTSALRGHGGELPGAPSGRVHGAELGRWGMVLFVINEATLFACLVSSYFYLALANPAWPPAGLPRPELTLPLIMTACLLSSSVVLVYAERGRAAGNRGRYRAGTAVAVLLGAAFLVLQLKEYSHTLREVRPSGGAYGSLFFTITGLHGAHVAFGLLFLLWAMWASARKPRQAATSLAIGNASLYWHFVDGVWLVILTSLYLSPRWA